MQSGNVFYSVLARYLATEFLYFRVCAHFQKHCIRIGDGQGLFNQAVLNQDAMIRRYGQRRWMGLRRSEEHTSELQSRLHLVCRLLLEKKKKKTTEKDHR